jgi:hypothetical protein
MFGGKSPVFASESLETALERWGKGGTLSGEEFAAHRQALRDLAAAVDAARDSGDAYDLSRCAAKFLEALNLYRMPEKEVVLDDFARLTAELARGPVRDTKKS